MQVIVVGAGIAGLSSAWSLTKRGHQVTLIEQGAIPNPLAASGDHHRIIRRAYGKASGYGRAITEAYRAWDELWSRPWRKPSRPARLPVRVARGWRRGRRISRRPGGGRLSVRIDQCRCGRAALAVPGSRHVPLRLPVAGRRGAALPQDRGRHCRLAPQERRRVYEDSKVVAVDPDQARSSSPTARPCRRTASSSPPAPGC